MKIQQLDTQQVEIVGRNLLTSLLTADGIEVAEPLRDKGVDLIAFSDPTSKKFKAIPIQLKASSASSFSIDKKYEKFPNLQMAYVWHVSEPLKASVYIMTYANAVGIAKTQKYTESESWKSNGYYVTNKPSRELIKLLDKYRYQSGRLLGDINTLQ